MTRLAQNKQPYVWKNLTAKVFVTDAQMKDMLWLWLLSLSKKRQARILDHMARRFSP